MSNLLQTLLSFIGVMLVLALAAQSIQEILKTMVVLKGNAQLKAMEGLVREATRFHGQYNIDAEAIIVEVKRRLAALGQKGWRKLRLDELGAKNLRDLVESAPVAGISAVPIAESEARKALQLIGERVEKWYPLALCPVENKYRRQMRVVALLASALVVIPLNAGAIRVFNLARSDPEFRRRVDSAAVYLMRVSDSANRASGTADSAAMAAHEIVKADSLGIYKPITRAELGSPSWYIGILLSILLVSLGAPFWHDLLEGLFGLKNRVRAEAERVRGEVRARSGAPP